MYLYLQKVAHVTFFFNKNRCKGTKNFRYMQENEQKNLLKLA